MIRAPRSSSRLDLLEHVRPDTKLAVERSVLRGDQHDRDRGRRGEEPQCDAGREPIVALYEGDGEEGEDGHEDHARPLGPIDARFADDDALTPGVERG